MVWVSVREKGMLPGGSGKEVREMDQNKWKLWSQDVVSVGHSKKAHRKCKGEHMGN